MVVLARRKQGSCGLSEGKGQFQVNQSKVYRVDMCAREGNNRISSVAVVRVRILCVTDWNLCLPRNAPVADVVFHFISDRLWLGSLRTT